MYTDLYTGSYRILGQAKKEQQLPPTGRAPASSLAEDVYQALRAAILRGTYRPNQRLVETEISDELGASRTPVREALLLLGNERLVVRTRHGWQVREFTVDEIREIHEVRAALEGYAARLAAQRGSEQQVLRLTTLIAEQREVATRAQVTRSAITEVGDRFHGAVIAAAGNDRLAALISANQTYYFTYQVANMYTDEELAATLDEHEQLCEAIRVGAADRAELLARQHILSAQKLMEQRF